MKKLILSLVFLSSLAQAAEIQVACDSSVVAPQLNRFDLKGSFNEVEAGRVVGTLTFSAVTASRTGIAAKDIQVSGTIEKFKAGEMMVGESAIIDIPTAKGSIRLFVNGPVASSTLMDKGIAYRSTCK